MSQHQRHPLRWGLYTLLLALGLGSAPIGARAQGAPLHHHPEVTTSHTLPTGALGIPLTRLGSGTSWIPDAGSMQAWHGTVGHWTGMLHGQVDLLLSAPGSNRGRTAIVGTNWLMASALRPMGAGLLHLRAMVSAEPATVGGVGYPLLLQTGESWQGEPLKDHQHPHDLVMELGASFEHPITPGLAGLVYAAAVGEPALGPPAFMHRPSAMAGALAPIAHHWQDATHISFGVLTGALFTPSLRIEGSRFNGRAPDERRTDIERHPLDSWSARGTWQPTDHWSLQASYGNLRGAEASHPDDITQRVSASVQHLAPAGKLPLSTAFIYGANRHEDHDWTRSIVAEGALGRADGTTLFLRGEWVEKSAGELVIDHLADDMRLPVTALTLGITRPLARHRQTVLLWGISGSIHRLPTELTDSYGTRTPLALAVWFRLRPAERGHHD